MSSSLTDDPLPPESEMNRSDMLRAFLAVLNFVQPPHPYADDPYPVTSDEVDYGFKRVKIASCGPRNPATGNKIAYKTRTTFVNNTSRERHLAVIVHEITHVVVGRHSDQEHGSHPPRFWLLMAEHAQQVYEGLRSGHLATIFPDADPERVLQEVVHDPNGMTVDRRYWSVNECRARLADDLDIEYCPEETTELRSANYVLICPSCDAWWTYEYCCKSVRQAARHSRRYCRACETYLRLVRPQNPQIAFNLSNGQDYSKAELNQRIKSFINGDDTHAMPLSELPPRSINSSD